MQMIRAVGREAATKKYDLMSAMMAHALAGDPGRQRLVLRLMALMTARYNWQRDELATGQREMARLWSVDERTVKREMARLRAMGWVVVKRQGARGRVSVLGLDLMRIWQDTQPQWDRIGPDFVARARGAGDEIAGDAGQGPSASPNGATVVPFPRAKTIPDEGSDTEGGHGAPDGIVSDTWARARADLAADNPALFGAWLDALREDRPPTDALYLQAPTRFHATYIRTHLMGRLLMAVRRRDPGIARIDVTCA